MRFVQTLRNLWQKMVKDKQVFLKKIRVEKACNPKLHKRNADTTVRAPHDVDFAALPAHERSWNVNL